MATAAPESRSPFPSSSDTLMAALHGPASGDTLAGQEGTATAPRLQQLQHKLGSARQRLQTGARRAREAGVDWRESLRCTVKEQPLSAVVAALALGLIVVRLSR